MEKPRSSGTQAFIDFLQSLNKDERKFKKFKEDFDLSLIGRECELITWVAIGTPPNWGLGDVIAYGLDYDYENTEIKRAHNLFYQWHGCGD